MSGTGPIHQVSNTGTAANARPARPAGSKEEQAGPADSVDIGSKLPTAPPDTTVITMRVAVPNTLLIPDESGKAPIEGMQPDLVKKGTASPNAPTYITAVADPGEVPPEMAPVSTWALAPKELAQDMEGLAKLNQDFYPAFVHRESYVVTPQELAEHDKQKEAEGFQRGLKEGGNNAIPPGFRAKMMDSEAGLKIEGRRDQISTMATMIGSTSAALGIAANIGIPAQYAGPLALATAPLTILGSTGTMSNMAKLEHQKAALIETVKHENPDKDPMKVVVDMNPHTQQVITTEDAIKNIDSMKTGQKVKTLGALLLAGAGIATVGGWGTAATALAIGSMGAPLGDAIPTFDKIGQTSQRKSELKAMIKDRAKELEGRQAAGEASAMVWAPVLGEDGSVKGFENKEMPIQDAIAHVSAGKEKVEVQVPIFNAEGAPVGFEGKDVPVHEALEHVKTQQKMLALGAVGAVAQAGTLVAMGLGAPIMMVVGASVAIPLLARGAMFPKESWETLKALPGKIWDGIKAVGNAIGRKLGWVKDSAGPDAQAQPMSPAQKALFETIGNINEADPQLADGLNQTLQALHRPPTNAEEQKAVLEAGEKHQALLAELKSKHPELAARFEGAMQGLFQEGQEQLAQQRAEASAREEEQRMERAHDQVDQIVASPFGQAVVDSDRVKAALKEVKGDRDMGERVLRMIAQSQVFNGEDAEADLRSQNDRDSQDQLKVYLAMKTEIQERIQASQTEKPAA